MRKLFPFLCLSAVLTIAHITSSACDCLMVYPVTRHVKTSELVLIVKTIDYEPVEFHHPKSGVRASVMVQEVLKGDVSAGQVLRFDAESPSSCAFWFEKDKEYLVFAFRKGDHFEVYKCSFSDEKLINKKRYRQLKRYIGRKGTSA